MSKQGKRKTIKHWMWISAGLMVYDFVAIHLAYFLSLWIRFDCRFSLIPQVMLQHYVYSAPIYAFLAIGIFWFFRMYRCMWRFASYPELFRFAAGSVLAGNTATSSTWTVFLLGRASLLALELHSLQTERCPSFAFLQVGKDSRGNSLPHLVHTFVSIFLKIILSMLVSFAGSR